MRHNRHFMADIPCEFLSLSSCLEVGSLQIDAAIHCRMLAHPTRKTGAFGANTAERVRYFLSKTSRGTGLPIR